MTYTIDSHTYNKAAAYPLRHGYQARGTAPTSIVVHSTEGVKGQALESAATYLYTSSKVSAHYLIGKAGEIVQFLDTKRYQAWHAGEARPAFVNARSIGIECLHARGETWPDAQCGALAWLLADLAARYAILARLVETHGQIAIPGPYIRKNDPTDWPHDAFLAWRDRILAAPAALARVKGVPVYQRQDRTGTVASWLSTGQIVQIDATYPDGGAHLASGLGFIDLNSLESL